MQTLDLQTVCIGLYVSLSVRARAHGAASGPRPRPRRPYPRYRDAAVRVASRAISLIVTLKYSYLVSLQLNNTSVMVYNGGHVQGEMQFWVQ